MQVFPGETVALIGESGSGKTTLANCLFRIVEPSERHFHELPRESSSGQRERAVIALALALQPKFIAADEPFSSLDVLAKSRLLDLFLSLQQQFDLAGLISSHDLALDEKWCDRVVILRAGRMVGGR